jgi:glutaredoxin
MSSTTPAEPGGKTATLYRMVLPEHTCPYGVEAKRLLERSGYAVEDNHLTSREQTDLFKAQRGVATTPLIFIGDERVGGCEDLRQRLRRDAP